MSRSCRYGPQPGEQVVLVAIPPGFLEGLEPDDQRAITAIVGQPVELVGYDEDGRAELQFADPFDVQTDEYSHTHSIWVKPEFIKAYRPCDITPARATE